jgi:hypothetical protein
MAGQIEFPDSEVEFRKFITRNLCMNESLDVERKGIKYAGIV